jgi:hypothetical protein
MPYRRLPNTDAARLRALKAAFIKGKELPPFNLAYSQSTFQKVQSFLPQFEKVLTENKFAYDNQVKKNRDYQVLVRKARLYISHFIQVLNLAIIRGDIPSNIRAIYGLDADEKKLPQLTTEAEIIEWGEKIIKGEAQRCAKGGAPMTNPTVAVVKVRYENFFDAYQSQKIVRKAVERTSHELIEIRKTADDLIQHIWNEVEEKFADLPDSQRREAASAYGLVYVFRSNELSNIDILDKATLSNLSTI